MTMGNAAARRSVTMIPAKVDLVPLSTEEAKKRLRVAGYARVSTDAEEQLNSYHAQVEYFTELIQANPEWEFAGIYTDEGITATSTKKREGFNCMIQDALDGKIDMILMKSISRFARNTVDSLTAIRRLKERGIPILFQKENINTLDSKGELMITILSSLAQEESRSISENVTWGQRKRFADGKVSLPYKRFLGYEKGQDGRPAIVEAEAEIVRRIYRQFLYGKAPSTIAAMLTDEGTPTPGGKQNWRPNTVESILTNEKYKGEAILQKKYTVDFLTKKQKVNEGEVPQYHVENSHPAIIQPEVFDLVQHELAKRKARGPLTCGNHCFSGRILCAECGGVFGSKTWGAGTKYKRFVWQCNHRYGDGHRCDAPHITDDEARQAFLVAFGAVLGNKASIFKAYEEIINTLTDVSALNTKHDALAREIEVISGLMRQCVQENASMALDQAEYQKRYDGLLARMEAALLRRGEMEAQRLERTAKRTRMETFMQALEEQGDVVTEFDEALFYTMVEHIRVSKAQGAVFSFKDGTEYAVPKAVWRV